MRQFYKSHGKHCYFRSFKTSCPSCGLDVLYWECKHGSKVYFQYPPYGKLIRHKCKKYKGKIKSSHNKYSVIVNPSKGLLEKASPSCPVCGKLFKSELNLKEHIKQLKKSDFLHRQNLEQENWFDNKKKKIGNDKMGIHYKPTFGKINLKKKTECL